MVVGRHFNFELSEIYLYVTPKKVITVILHCQTLPKSHFKPRKQCQYLTKFGTDTAPQPQLNAAGGVSESEQLTEQTTTGGIVP